MGFLYHALSMWILQSLWRSPWFKQVPGAFFSGCKVEKIVKSSSKNLIRNFFWNFFANATERKKDQKFSQNQLVSLNHFIKEVFLNGPHPASFPFCFRLFKQTNSTIFTTNQCEKMYIKYTVLGFEPMISWTWVVSFNH